MSANELTGVVTDAELCRPVPEVHILLRLSGDGQETVSDGQGRWSISDPGPDAKISFTKAGYVPKTYRTDQLPGMVRLLETHLLGYQDRLWYLPEDRIPVYVQAAHRYSAKVYRHGFEKELILDLGTFNAQSQAVPDGIFVESGLSWERSFAYTIPASAVPGLYSLLLESDAGEKFAIPFVLSTPPDRYGTRAQILVLASTTTWQSYNIWGGRSRYRNFEEGGSPGYKHLDSSLYAAVRAKVRKWVRVHLQEPALAYTGKEKHLPSWYYKKLTMKRPYTNCALEEETVFRPFTNHLAAGEWRVLAWLEREKIPYDIVTGYEMHRNPDLLAKYRSLILSTHCEYWSRAMYEGVRRYHQDNGLWILNLSGNTMYREIEFYEDGSTHCVSVSFEKTVADETQLLGVRFSPEVYGSCSYYRILQPAHWVFAHLPRAVRVFGGLSLNQNTPDDSVRYNPGRPGSVEKGSEYALPGMGSSGWETDRLSSTAPRDIVIVARGQNPHGGADMVVRDPKGTRGGMFSASSVVFGGSLLIDQNASSIVHTVITRSLEGKSVQP